MTGLRSFWRESWTATRIPKGQGGLAVAHGRPSVVASLVGGHAELRVEAVERLLGVADGVPLGVGVGVVEHVG